LNACPAKPARIQGMAPPASQRAIVQLRVILSCRLGWSFPLI
jgi:hypothetical protein